MSSFTLFAGNEGAVTRKKFTDPTSDTGAKSFTGSICGLAYIAGLMPSVVRGGHQQRVAVGRRLRHDVGADQRARAGAVLDHDGLLERRGQAIADGARQHVGERAGRIRHDEAQRPGRIILRLRREREQRGNQQSK